jgi:hypothetical protein
VNAPPALASRSPSPVEPVPADDELSLAALLDLFAPEEPAAASTAERRSFRSSGAALGAWTQKWSQRATEWGAGPQGSWRAW